MPKANRPRAEPRLHGLVVGLATLALSVPSAADIAAGENGSAGSAQSPPPKVSVSGSASSGETPLPERSSGGQAGSDTQPALPDTGAGRQDTASGAQDTSAGKDGGTTTTQSDGGRSSSGHHGNGSGPRVTVHTGIWDVIKGIFGGGGRSNGPPKPPKGEVPGSQPSGKDSGSGTPGPQTGSIPGPQQPGSPGGSPQGKPEGSPNGRPNGSPNGSPDGTAPEGAPKGAPGEDRSVVLDEATKEFRKAEQRRRAGTGGGNPDVDQKDDPWRKASSSSSKSESQDKKQRTASTGPRGSRSNDTAKSETPPSGTSGGGPSSPDDEFEKALRDFDGTILKERGIILARNTERARAGGLPPPPDEKPQEEPPAEGAPDTPDDSRSGAGNMPNLPQRKGDYQHTARRYTPPADIPDGSDDDVFARQLREAAETEPDPDLRKAMWEEYRRYKEGK